jgi:hypothetical protein
MAASEFVALSRPPSPQLQSTSLPCLRFDSTDKLLPSSITTPLLTDTSPPASASSSDVSFGYRAAKSPSHLCPSTEDRNELLGIGHTFHPLDMPAAYALRDGGDAKNKKQSMADLKLRRLNELNLRLKEDLDRPRVKVAEASMS